MVHGLTEGLQWEEGKEFFELEYKILNNEFFGQLFLFVVCF